MEKKNKPIIRSDKFPLVSRSEIEREALNGTITSNTKIIISVLLDIRQLLKEVIENGKENSV